jgi:hypothetical protein
MTLSMVPHGRGETLRFFKTAYFGLKVQSVIDPKIDSWFT